MKFNINNYKGKYVMHCKTEEEARSFCNYLHSIGRKWTNGDSYLSDTAWKSYCTGTVYYFNSGEFGCRSKAGECEYTILEWEDFMTNTFSRADLKTGDIIKCRNGLVGIVHCDMEVIITPDNWYDLDNWRLDLTNIYDNEIGVDAKFDIVEVKRLISKDDCETVYEREETEEMTLAEVCKLLGKNIKIIQ